MAYEQFKADIAEMRRLNPTQFPDDASAIEWGKRYYGWDNPPAPPAPAAVAPPPAATSGAQTSGVPTLDPKWLGTAADWANPQASWQRVDAVWGGTMTPEQRAYVQQQISAGGSAANPFASASYGSGTATPSDPNAGKLNVPVEDAPAFEGPQWQAPTGPYTGPTSFTAPGAEGMYADPGYQFRLNQGLKALTADRAARGIYRGGNTLTALNDYAQGMASQEYGNVWNRAVEGTKLNANLATDAWGRDRDERRDAFDATFRTAEATYAPKFATWTGREAAKRDDAISNWAREWDRERYNRDDAYRQARDANDLAYRWGTYRGDDEFRRLQLEEQRRQYLASLGNY